MSDPQNLSGFAAKDFADAAQDDPDRSSQEYYHEFLERTKPLDSMAMGSGLEELISPRDRIKPYHLQIFDGGHHIHLSGTKDKPVTDEQIAHMINHALNKKGWNTLYMYNHEGKRDLVMAERVQKIIERMGLERRITSCQNPDPEFYPLTSKDFLACRAKLFANNKSTGRAGYNAPALA